jgi:hypothetical protein
MSVANDGGGFYPEVRKRVVRFLKVANDSNFTGASSGPEDAAASRDVHFELDQILKSYVEGSLDLDLVSAGRVKFSQQSRKSQTVTG